MTNFSKHKHTGTVNPVREGETLVAVWFRSGFEYFTNRAEHWIWSHHEGVNPANEITDYAVSPPRVVDWTKPLVTNMGTAATLLYGPDCDGDYAVYGDFGGGKKRRFFKADGSQISGEPTYVRNAPEAADKPDTRTIFAVYKSNNATSEWEKLTDIPDDNVAMRPAIVALDARLAELDADRERVMRAMRILRGEG